MSLYQMIGRFGPKFVKKSRLFKHGFNWSPMYRRSTAKIIYASEDLHIVRVVLPISYKNRNYVGSIFGGSMFSAVDPIPMVQLINILGNQYIVWDRSAEVIFKAPAREDLVASFSFTEPEIASIRAETGQNGQMEIVKTTQLTSRDGRVVFCEVRKTIYIATRQHHRSKSRREA